MKLIIHTTVKNADEFNDMLEHIKGLIAQGYTSGYYPTWEIVDSNESQQ